MKWYIVQVQSGQEQKVSENIKMHAARQKAQMHFGEIIVPLENVVDIVGGKQKHSERKLFPGYVLVQMHLDENTWGIILNVPKVSNFLGTAQAKGNIDISRIPTLTEKEVEDIVNRVKHSESDPTIKKSFTPGDVVRINQGPFNDFNGTIEEANYERNMLKITVVIFGRATPVEIDMDHTEAL